MKEWNSNLIKVKLINTNLTKEYTHNAIAKSFRELFKEDKNKWSASELKALEITCIFFDSDSIFKINRQHIFLNENLVDLIEKTSDVRFKRIEFNKNQT